MADEVDRANDYMEIGLSADIANARHAAGSIPAGEPGDCEMCGEWSGRLVHGVCAPCRDKFKLP